MSDSLISALIQAPFVLVIVYLMHRFLSHLNARDLEWRAFTEEMHKSMGDRLGDLTEAIDRLSQLMIAHDAATRMAVASQPVRRSDPPAASGDETSPLRQVG